MTIRTTSVEQTVTLGRLIGELAPPNTCIALNGNLGAGKTQLTRGIAQGAAVEDATLVASPTYVLLNIYQGPKPVYHLDAYRIVSEEDFEVVGLDEALKSGTLVVVEWAEKIPHLLPEDRLTIAILPQEDQEHRLFVIEGTGPTSRELAARIEAPKKSKS
ncbi:MAG: tRNA (adenosine(37)-N6)-threonylcarbamoyltransferase complex ATPase subunit type 1 TsaE [Phycisphaerales bacterium]|nr:tRNA (adenosine(37)-N6)-threonylcarbamoyltransferase complex ATPase subunit type 1 TsaE [Phycisphaerales bacterium]